MRLPCALLSCLALLALPTGCLHWPDEPAKTSLSSGPSQAHWKQMDFLNTGEVS